MKTQHTPGPWKATRCCVEDSKKRMVAGTSTLDIAGEEAKANARLIAAAPELLATLNVLAEIAEQDGLDHLRPFSQKEMTLEQAHQQATLCRGVLITMAKAARAAIASAQGE